MKPANIDPEAFYDQDGLRLLLGLSNRVIGDACRSGELRYSDRAARRFFRGEWIIRWLEGDQAKTLSENPD